MRNALIIFISILLLANLSCRRDAFEYQPGLVLEFSTDTVLFDTVFVRAGSITKRVKVYNRSKKDVLIKEVFLAGLKFNGTSQFRLNVNGNPSNAVTEVEIASGDSIYIFSEVTIDPTAGQLPFVVRDSILFDLGGSGFQQVYLEAFGQNARFFTSEELVCNSVWDNSLPIVIYNSALVGENCKLTIQAGTQIFFNAGSFLFVEGMLEVKGTEMGPVVFRGDRLDEFYRDQAGGWGGIHILQSSQDNRIDFAEVSNALIGIRVDSLSNNSAPKLILNNSKIQNHVLAGVLGYTADLEMNNCLISDCGRFASAGLLGGKWNMKHCTIGNFSFNFSRNDPAAIFSNGDLLDEDDNFIRANDMDLSLVNCVFWGDRDEEAILDKSGRGTWVEDLKNNLVRTKLASDWDNTNVVNQNPKFVNPIESDYKIDTLSPAFKTGFFFNPATYPILEKGLGGNSRNNPPTIGAYERVE